MVCTKEELKKIAVAIPSYRRPEFLKRCIAAVAAMPEVQAGVPVFLLADGGLESQRERCMAAFLAEYVPDRTVICRTDRHRQPRNMILGKQELFSRGFEWVAIIEEDVVVHQHWLALMLSLHRWADENFDNCGMVGSSIVDDANDPAWVSDAGQSICNHLISKRAWTRIWPMLCDYLDRVPESEERDDPRVIQVQRWFNEQAARIPAGGPRSIPHHWRSEPKDFYLAESVPASQDAAHDLALRVNGMARLVCDANRAVHIGSYGEHTTQNEKYDQTLKGWPEDADRTSFVLRRKRPAPAVA